MKKFSVKRQLLKPKKRWKIMKRSKRWRMFDQERFLRIKTSIPPLDLVLA